MLLPKSQLAPMACKMKFAWVKAPRLAVLPAWDPGSGERSSPHRGFAPLLGERGRKDDAAMNNQLLQTMKLNTTVLLKRLGLRQEAIQIICSDLELPPISGLCFLFTFVSLMLLPKCDDLGTWLKYWLTFLPQLP